MDPARYRRLRDVVHGAGRRQGEALDLYLAEACGGDALLEEDARRLLSSAAVATEALSPGAPDVPEEPALPTLPPGTVIGGLTVERTIGRGGMGTVYAARAAEGGSLVALKVFHPHLLASAQARERFAREASLGGRVEHPNVVRTLGAGQQRVGHEVLPYLVMEYVEGQTLRALLADLGRVGESLLREIALPLADGLAALHEAGVVHRDLKPENVMITEDRRVRIADLGIAKTDEASTILTVDGQFLGSLHYASPEQCEGGAVGPASDLYSLGVVLYELATGTNPFAAEGLLAIARAHVESTPTPPKLLAPDLSPFLDAVIRTLLEKDPAVRFPSSRALCQVLRAGEDGAWWTARREREVLPPRLSGLPLTGICGRDSELRALLGAWEEAQRGEARFAVVEGGPGIGKSRLVDALVERLSAERPEVILCAYDPRGSGGIREALARRYAAAEGGHASLAEHLAGVPALIEPFAAMLRREVQADGSPLLPRASLTTALVHAARGLARDRPLLWVVEDLHHADGDARALLRALTRSLTDVRVLFVVATRGPLDAADEAHYAALPHVLRLPLSALGAEDVESLLQQRLGDAALARRLAPRVHARTGGVPLFVFEVLRSLEAEGYLARMADGTWVEGRRIADVAVPRALRDAVLARVRDLEPEERAIVDAAAVQGALFDADLIARLRGVPRLRVLEVLGRLERRRGLVQSVGLGHRFEHELIRDVLLEDLPPALRQEIHGGIARAWSDRAGGAAEAAGSEADWRIAYHALRGPAPEEALPWLGSATRALQSNYRFEAAADLLARALRLGERLEPARRVPILVQLGRHAGALGRREEARSALEEAVRLADEVGEEAPSIDARTALAYHLLAVADYERALEIAFETEERIAAAGSPHKPEVEILGAHGQIYWCLGRYEEAAKVHERVLSLAREHGDLGSEAKALSNLAVLRHELGFAQEAADLLQRSTQISRERGDRQTEAPALMNLGNALHDLGRKREAMACYEQAIAFDAEAGLRDGESIAWVNVGEVRSRWGDFPGARQAYHRSLALVRETGARRVEAFSHHGLGVLAAWEGSPAEARRKLEEALAIRQAIANRTGVADTLVALGRLLVETGRGAQARAHLEEAVRIARDATDVSTVAEALAVLARLDSGELAAAESAVEEARDRLRSDQAVQVYVDLAHASDDRRWLDRARPLVEHLVQDAPPEAQAAMVRLVPTYRAVMRHRGASS